MTKPSKKPEWITRILTQTGSYQLDLANVFLFAAIGVAVPYYALAAFNIVPLSGVWYDTMQIVGFSLLAICVIFMFSWNGNVRDQQTPRAKARSLRKASLKK